MNKRIVRLIIVAFLPFLVSCGGKKTVYPDLEQGLILEIRADGRSPESRMVLCFDKTENRYRGKVIEPEEFSNVSLTYENGAVTIISGNVVLPFDEKSGTGIAVIFQVLDDMSAYGAPEKGRRFDIDGYHIEIEPSPTQRRIAFSINGPCFKRSFVLSDKSE
ncbi:MAG: hypothetical protein IKH09_10025 [Clostridia bacterium]|nr:hypothetical protein [Clostridia bacterium]